jgi:hypothetical protein
MTGDAHSILPATEWLESRWWDSWREAQNWLREKGDAAIRIGNDCDSAAAWLSGVAFDRLLFACLSWRSPAPEAVELSARNRVVVGANTALYVVGQTEVDQIAFGTPFHQFAAATEQNTTAVFETGLLSLDANGAPAWRLDTDLVISHEIDQGTIRLQFQDDPPRVVDMRTGRDQ